MQCFATSAPLPLRMSTDLYHNKKVRLSNMCITSNFETNIFSTKIFLVFWITYPRGKLKETGPSNSPGATDFRF